MNHRYTDNKNKTDRPEDTNFSQESYAPPAQNDSADPYLNGISIENEPVTANLQVPVMAQNRQPKKNRKLLIVTIILLAVAGIAVGLWFFVFKDMVANAGADPVYVSSVGSITGLDMGTTPRYAGIVEPQKTVDVKKNESLTVLSIYVTEDQEVFVGDKLFSYDTEELNLNLQQANLDLDNINNTITTLKAQITDFEKQRDKASSDEKPYYTAQIASAQLSIKEQEYNLGVKNKEIENIEKSIENADVYSEVEGVIKAINENGGTDSTGQALPFISIRTTGDYLVKGTITEQTIQNISEGQTVVVHSRVDATATWTGIIQSIDFENTVSNNNNMYYGPDTSQQSSKYNFYVAMDNLEGLILGQHVYIEPSSGMPEKEGLWLPAFYIAHDDTESFVWARGSDERLEKRTLILGEYDSENDSYQIISGISAEDYIAYPDENHREGMPTTVDQFSASGNADPGMTGDGFIDDGTGDGMDGGVLNPSGDADGYTEGGDVYGDDPYGESGIIDGGESTDDYGGYPAEGYDENGNLIETFDNPDATSGVTL